MRPNVLRVKSLTCDFRCAGETGIVQNYTINGSGLDLSGVHKSMESTLTKNRYGFFGRVQRVGASKYSVSPVANGDLPIYPAQKPKQEGPGYRISNPTVHLVGAPAAPQIARASNWHSPVSCRQLPREVETLSSCQRNDG